MTIWTLVNIFCAWLLLKWAKTDFEQGNTKLGWLNLIFSAWNVAAAANAIF